MSDPYVINVHEADCLLACYGPFKNKTEAEEWWEEHQEEDLIMEMFPLNPPSKGLNLIQ